MSSHSITGGRSKPKCLAGPARSLRLRPQRSLPPSKLSTTIFLKTRAPKLPRRRAREIARNMQNDFVKLAPPILAPAFARLGEQVTDAARPGAHRIHVDVMEG